MVTTSGNRARAATDVSCSQTAPCVVERGADGPQRVVVTEGELTRWVEQPETALALELDPEVACHERHLDIVGVGIAEPEDAGATL